MQMELSGVRKASPASASALVPFILKEMLRLSACRIINIEEGQQSGLWCTR